MGQLPRRTPGRTQARQEDWRGLIASELQHAVDAGEIKALDPELTAFQVDAVLIAANTAIRLGDRHAAAKVRRVIACLLAPGEQP
jgi:hypothetical protein